MEKQNKPTKQKFLFADLTFPTSGLESLCCQKLVYWSKEDFTFTHKLPLYAILTISSLNFISEPFVLKAVACLFAFLENNITSLCSPSIHISV